MGKEKNLSRHRLAGGIEYELVYKKVKRFNLRVHTDGTVTLSIPKRVPLSKADQFVAQNARWVGQAKERVRAIAPKEDIYSDGECAAAFLPVLDRLYPLVADHVPEKPALRVRFMTSRWGVCHIQKGYITLNKQLLGEPYEALEYVVLHELVHFIHPDHQAGFHQEMARLMPDYRERRKLLRG